MNLEDTIAHLNRLIETSKDGELGYRTASHHVRNPQLQTIFEDYEKQRAHFARQLQSEVERLGGDAGASGSLAAAIHRGWIDVKSALSGGDGSAIVAACEAGEEGAVAAYEKVLDMDISGETRTLVSNQSQQVREAHEHMMRLKESKTAAAGSSTNDMKQKV
ncbi:MAG: hypothetical protein JWP63_5268 [Candidatus Solibacter sp.]|nr:hypothetical protein [Candidatus Solibacter sp.]